MHGTPYPDVQMEESCKAGVNPGEEVDSVAQDDYAAEPKIINTRGYIEMKISLNSIG